MLSFFAKRAIPGVEVTDDTTYHRTVSLNDTTGSISVSLAPNQNALSLQVCLSDNRDLLTVVERVRRMFDLDANMTAIHEVLAKDPILAPLIQKRPGLRLPGAWEAFEVAVRAVVGQQVSVKAARTVVGRIATKAGRPFDRSPHPGLSRYFPTAQDVSQCDLDGIGMPQKRIDSVKILAQDVASGSVDLSAAESTPEFVDALTRIPGIGPWTAEYIAMRGLAEPDAFPETDLGIIRGFQAHISKPTRQHILARSQAWRPWRAYAAIHLWHQ